MKKAFLILSVLAISALAMSGATLQTQTNHPYFQMRTGDNFTFRIRAMTGTWDDATSRLTVTSLGDERPAEVISYFTSTCPLYFGPDAPIFGQYFHLVGTPNTPAQPWATIYNGGWAINGVYYLGDIVDERGHVKVPAEPEITMNPIAGEVLESTNTVVYESCTNQTILTSVFHWKYRTIEHLSIWGDYTDVWRTGLREYGDPEGGLVYNWYFVNSVDGPAHVDYGVLNTVTGVVTGWQYEFVGNNITPTPTATATQTATPTETVTPTITPTATPQTCETISGQMFTVTICLK